MKFYGNASFQQDGAPEVSDALAGDGSAQIRNGALQTLTQFPSVPKVGQIAFVNSIVYICVTAGSLPVWVPLTREITAYTHAQEAPSTAWNITHNLNTSSVNIQIFDATNKVIIPNSIETTGSTTAVVTFGTAQTGRAVCLSGHFDGQLKPMYAYTHFQGTAGTTWTVNHSLGYNPIVRVFIGNQEVQPLTVTHTSTSQVVLTFNTPQVGYARMI